MRGEDTWPCKIGKTDQDPLARILGQSSTALPEKPQVAFIIKTSNSYLLESMLHSILKMRGKQVEGLPGLEWFNTNPDEVLEIVSYINPSIIENKK